MKRIILLVIALSVVLSLVGCQAMTTGGDLNLENLLLYLMTGPGIGIAISIVLEKFPFAQTLFDKIPGLEWKRLTVLALCVLFSTGAMFGAARLGYVVLDENLVFSALAAAWEAFTTSTVLHGFIRNNKE